MVWRMVCVNGRWVWREESGLGKEEEEEKKKKKRKKRDGLKDERAIGSQWPGKEKTGHRKRGPPCEYIYKNAIITLFP